MLVLKNRILLPDGCSVVTVEEAARMILKEGDIPPHFFVEPSEDSYEYDVKYKKDTMFIDDEHVIPSPVHTVSDEQSQMLIEKLEQSPRFSGSSDEISRIEEEFEFFERTNNLFLLLKLIELIDKFKQDNVVWGVGRGSSVASFILYLLEVHDINPIEYDIPFNELSKE